MKIRTLHWKRAVFAVLLTLLLSAIGVTNAVAQEFTVGNLNYSVNDDGSSVTVTGYVSDEDGLYLVESVEINGTSYPVTAIGNSAFMDYTWNTGHRWETCVIPNSVTTIGDHAFKGVDFGELSIGNSVITIGDYAFWWCSWEEDYWWQHVTLPNSVTTIGDYAFSYCDSFTGDLVIPDSVTSIGEGAFEGCRGFTGSLTIGNSVTTIGPYAFYGCSGFLGSLTIGNSVTVIDWQAFAGCSGFTGNLIIPNSITSISEGAFEGCNGFSSIVLFWEDPLWWSWIDGVNYDIPLVVPCGTGSLYQNTEGWNNFTNIIENCSNMSVVSATANPTEGGTVSGGGEYGYGAECTLTAMPNEGYTFKNWTEHGNPVSFDASYSFTVIGYRILVANFVITSNDNHEYVDLGLPSGTLWATCNVGADVPEDYGDYFAWGETQPKVIYNWSTYQHCMGSGSTLTKYCDNSYYGNYAFVDHLTTLLPEDDAATVNWGTGWCMPTPANWQELLDNTTCTWITQNGVSGRLFTAANGNSLFLPAAGLRWAYELGDVGYYGGYWSSSIVSYAPDIAYYFYSYPDYCGMDSYWYGDRYYGQSVRPVRSTFYTINATPTPSEGGTTSGAGEYICGATCTLIATANEGYTFINWTENDEVVSIDATYSFMVNDNRNLVANFALPFTITATANPSEGGTVTGAGEYDYGTTCTLTATPNEGYIFVDWTENGNHISYDSSYSFTASEDRTLIANFVLLVGSHDYVDLGLPSGTLWATCNVGASIPESDGDYFAWGETLTKNYFNWGNYQYSNGSYLTLTKYCSEPYYGNDGYSDWLSILLPEDDAATGNWGTAWRTPTNGEWQELYNNTTSTWTTQNGVNGILFTASNGNSIFFPAAGYRNNNSLNYAGSNGYYWSSSLNEDYPANAKCLKFGSDYCNFGSYSRCCGLSVRAVRSSSQVLFYVINATASSSEGGEVIGAGAYEAGTTCTLTATANEGYTFISWIENGNYISYDTSYSFTVTENRTLVAKFAILGGNSHDFVDLGLPSGTMWAICNVGADAPVDYGDYFAWGETQPKDHYDWSTYQYCNGSENTLTKYCHNADYGYNGFTDTLTVLLPEDDAARTNWGNNWRMPTNEEWQELVYNTSCKWMTLNGVNGRLFTAANGNSLFLPAAGYYESNLEYEGDYGFYWSSSLSTGYTEKARCIYFYSDSYWNSSFFRNCGQSVRAVCSGFIVDATANPAEGGEVSGGGIYDTGTTCTLAAIANEGYSFINWTENGEVVSTEAVYSFTVTSNATFVANFQLNSYEITVAANSEEGGTIAGAGIYNHFETCTLTATPNEGYVFLNWTENGTVVSADAEYSFTVTGNRTLVANFTDNTNAITQITNFLQGWNWWSTYIEQDGIDVLSLIENRLGSNGLVIKSQSDGYTEYYDDYDLWYGSLNAINNESSYMVKTSAPCQVSMTGTTAVPSQHPITVDANGWTWIGYPVTYNMDINAALDGLASIEGDMLKAQEGYAEFYEGYGWYGSLDTLTSGMGYMYKSTSTSPTTFTYPDNGRTAMRDKLSAKDNHWVTMASAYPFNMTVTAVVELDGEELRSDRYELAAFANGESRGSVRLMYVEPIDRYVAFLTIAGEEAVELSFALYDTETGMECFPAEESVVFEANATIGRIGEPFVVSFRGTTSMDELANSLRVYPNPVKAGERFSIGMNAECKAPVRVEIVNALGAVVSVETSTQAPASIKAPEAAGIYTLKISCEKGTCYSKLIVR